MSAMCINGWEISWGMPSVSRVYRFNQLRTVHTDRRTNTNAYTIKFAQFSLVNKPLNTKKTALKLGMTFHSFLAGVHTFVGPFPDYLISKVLHSKIFLKRLVGIVQL